MTDTKDKQWSKKEVADAHGYNAVDRDTVTVFGAKFAIRCGELKPKHGDQLKILDIGCGNARIVNALNHFCKQPFDYMGTDINETCIEYAFRSVQVRQGSSARIILHDADDIPWKTYNNGAFPQKYDICLIDSTLCMFEDPEKVLIECDKYCDIIYVTRIKISEKHEAKVKTKMKWGGMDEESTYNLFGQSFFDNFVKRNGRKISNQEVCAGFEVVGSNTYVIEMVRR